MSDEKRGESVKAMLEIARNMTIEDAARATINMVNELYDTNRTMPIIGGDPIKEAELRGFMRAVEMLRSDEALGFEMGGRPNREQWARFLEMSSDCLEARKP